MHMHIAIYIYIHTELVAYFNSAVPWVCRNSTHAAEFNRASTSLQSHAQRSLRMPKQGYFLHRFPTGCALSPAEGLFKTMALARPSP